MTTEWKDLPTMQDVAEAQAQGWEINECYCSTLRPWVGKMWRDDAGYVGRPRQPKMKKVVSLCWRQKQSGKLVWEDQSEIAPNPDYWDRFPTGDIEGEVPDDN